MLERRSVAGSAGSEASADGAAAGAAADGTVEDGTAEDGTAEDGVAGATAAGVGREETKQRSATSAPATGLTRTIQCARGERRLGVG